MGVSWPCTTALLWKDANGRPARQVKIKINARRPLAPQNSCTAAYRCCHLGLHVLACDLQLHVLPTYKCSEKMFKCKCDRLLLCHVAGNGNGSPPHSLSPPLLGILGFGF